MIRAPAPRTLIWTTGELGHTLDHLPLLRALARDGRQLILVGSREEARVLDPTLLRLRLDHTPDALDAPLSLEPAAATPRLERLHLDEIVLLRATSRLLLRLARLREVRVVGVAPRWRGDLGRRLDVRVRPPTPVDATADADADAGARTPSTVGALMEALGLPAAASTQAADDPDAGLLVVPETWRAVGAERLRAAKLDLDEDGPLVGVSASRAGGRVGRWRGWPRERFTELTRGLRRRDPRRRLVVLAAGEEELWHAVRLHEDTGRIHPVIGPDLHLDGIAAVISHLDLFVGHDSKLLDLAVVLDVPTVGLFQSRSPSTVAAPRGPSHRVLVRRHLGSLDIDTVLDEAGGLLMEPHEPE